jgi:hypothetical protein
MSVPDLPTDNIFKFLTIFGLLMIGYSGYIHFNYKSDLKIARIEASKQFSLLELESKILTDRSETLNKTLQVDKDFFNCLKTNKKDFETNIEVMTHCDPSLSFVDGGARVRYEEALDENNKIIKLGYEIEKQAIQVKGQRALLKHQQEQLLIISIWAWFFSIVGFITMSFGFLGWYRKESK